MEKQLPWVKFVDKLNLLEDLIETYYKLRMEFKKEGWTKEDLERPPYYPPMLLQLRGHSPLKILIAKPSTMAVLPQPGSPIIIGLFFFLRDKI